MGFPDPTTLVSARAQKLAVPQVHLPGALWTWGAKPWGPSALDNHLFLGGGIGGKRGLVLNPLAAWEGC